MCAYGRVGGGEVCVCVWGGGGEVCVHMGGWEEEVCVCVCVCVRRDEGRGGSQQKLIPNR